jgi:uncharacterized protein (DUF885 family)
VADTLAALAEEFWTWRTVSQPDSRDDLPRVDRPPGWRPDWSSGAIAERRRVLADLTRRHAALDLSGEPVGVQVDGRLLGSALARVHGELELVRAWQRDPVWYLDQSLGAVYVALLAPPPFDEERAAAVLDRLGAVPDVLAQARENLANTAAEPFARYAVRLLSEVDGCVEDAMAALRPLLPSPYADRLPAAAAAAAQAVAGYRDWLAERAPSWGDVEPIGAAALGHLLHKVALLPHPAGRLREMGRQEWNRAVGAETALRARHHDASAPELPHDVADLVARQQACEYGVRGFCVYKRLLSLPDSLRHYRFAERPGYLAALSWLGVCDDLTSPARAGADATRWVSPPGPDLPYFDAAATLDPRTAIAHEGVHAQQLALGWAHANPARRHFYDSVPNEGIAFYHEELMLTSGLFDDAPASAVFIANAMRLRALRVEVDLALAVGDLTIEQAADRLARTVPVDRQTAWEEAVFFAGNPGQGLSYTTGKLQILDLLATATLELGTEFDLRGFHDRLWREGNVPLALQRWELLGLRDHLDEADRLAAT